MKQLNRRSGRKLEMPPAGSFQAEYAKSGRAVCKKCQKYISEGSVRIGMYVQSQFFDGATAQWYHSDCSLKAHVGRKLMSIDNLLGLESLRWEDQQKIREKFAKYMEQLINSGETLTEEGFRVEYAKSGGSKCRGCTEKIPKSDVRLGFLVDGPYGPIPAWHHVDCYIKHQSAVCHPLATFNGHKNLEPADAEVVDAKLRSAIGDRNEAPPAEINLSAVAQVETIKAMDADKELSQKLQKQSDELWEFKDKVVEASLKRDSLEKILEQNGIHVHRKSPSELVNIIADIAFFGVAPECLECRKSRLIWYEATDCYHCPTMAEWGECTGTLDAKDLKRPEKCKIPKDVKIPGLAASRLRPHIRIVNSLAHSKKPPKRVMNIEDLNMKRKETEDNDNVREKEKRVKVKFKGRSAVDPDTDLVDSHHIYEDKSSSLIYSVALAEADIRTGKNSFYHIQLLEGDWMRSNSEKSMKGKGSANYYVFRKWGRVGTSIGDSRLMRCESLQEAVDTFCDQFEHKTGNKFGEAFKKKPMMFYPIDLAQPEHEVETKANAVEPGSKTKLPLAVQNLLKLFFDVDAMRRALIEMEVDVDKMPLGQISKKQIKEAYSVLSTLLDHILGVSKDVKVNISARTNQFYTLVPHNFGMAKAKMLDNGEVIKEKLQLLETLLDMEVATKLIQREISHGNDDPLDIHYKSLNSEIEPLKKSSPEFKMISKYLETTHAPSHTEYRLKIDQVFKFCRDDERETYQEFLNKHPEAARNRKLLWHGSRLTNYVGIISQGLRIAPPEAPVTGYMFGKGVYFSDMVSKSANYCCTSADQDTGVLILSEVALGKQYELTESQFLEKIPAGYHSTKGCGKTIPSSSLPFSPPDIEVPAKTPEVETLTQRSTRNKKSAHSEVECPVGPPIKNKNVNVSELHYNEYVVYNTQQILMRYLVQVKFEYDVGKRRR